MSAYIAALPADVSVSAILLSSAWLGLTTGSILLWGVAGAWAILLIRLGSHPSLAVRPLYQARRDP